MAYVGDEIDGGRDLEQDLLLVALMELSVDLRGVDQVSVERVVVFCSSSEMFAKAKNSSKLPPWTGSGIGSWCG